MAWRLRAGLLFVAGLGVVGAVMAGCGDDGPDILGNCPLSVSLECCKCEFLSSCPQPDPKNRPWDYAPPWGLEPLSPKCCAEWRVQTTYDANPVCLEDLDGGTDGSSSGGSMGFCASGVCVPAAPEGWTHVDFFMGWAQEIPACPDDAPVLAFEGSPAPPDRACPACSCDAPEGTCHLPTTWTVSSEVCPGDNGVKTNFDPPAVGWDGSCTDDNAIVQGKLCGGVPCVRSITISPPVIEEKPCTPHTQGEGDLPEIKAWSEQSTAPIGRACTSKDPLPSCSAKGCVGTNSEFSACILHDGDEACPEGWNGDRHVLYESIDDARECTPCGCDAPTDGSCQVKFRTFGGASCSAENEASDVYSGMNPAPCKDYNPGEPLVGKTAEIVNYTKGTCAPIGGELKGDLTLAGQVTVCCFAATM